MKITVGYKYRKNISNPNLVDLIFRDWLIEYCSTLAVDENKKEFTLTEEEFVWLLFAYPSTSLSKVVSIDFDNHIKQDQDQDEN